MPVFTGWVRTSGRCLMQKKLDFFFFEGFLFCCSALTPDEGLGLCCRGGRRVDVSPPKQSTSEFAVFELNWVVGRTSIMGTSGVGRVCCKHSNHWPSDRDDSPGTVTSEITLTWITLKLRLFWHFLRTALSWNEQFLVPASPVKLGFRAENASSSWQKCLWICCRRCFRSVLNSVE